MTPVAAEVVEGVINYRGRVAPVLDVRSRFGFRHIRDAGGHLIAQDRETSEVYRMPHAAVEADAVDAVLPLDAIAGRLDRLTRAGRRALPSGESTGGKESRS